MRKQEKQSKQWQRETQTTKRQCAGARACARVELNNPEQIDAITTSNKNNNKARTRLTLDALFADNRQTSAPKSALTAGAFSAARARTRVHCLTHSGSSAPISRFRGVNHKNTQTHTKQLSLSLRNLQNTKKRPAAHLAATLCGETGGSNKTQRI